MSKKIATLITNLFEDVEYTEPAQAFKEAGHEVITIDKQSGNQVTGKKGTTVKIDKSIDEVHPADFDALLIPGGFSPDLLREDDRFGEFAKAFIQDGKPVFAICHGPQVLIDTDLLKGVDITGYKSIRNDLKNAGANFKDEEVVEGNLIWFEYFERNRSFFSTMLGSKGAPAFRSHFLEFVIQELEGEVDVTEGKNQGLSKDLILKFFGAAIVEIVEAWFTNGLSKQTQVVAEQVGLLLDRNL